MSSGVEVLTPLSKTQVNASHQAEEDMLAKMEAIQDAVNPYLEKMGVVADPPLVIDAKMGESALETVNEIRKAYGEEPITNASVTRRLLTLLNRVATVVEKHLLNEREIAFDEELKVRDETIGELQHWTRLQGGAHILSGFGAVGLMIASTIIGGPVGDALKQIATTGMTQAAAGSADKLIESWKMPGEHGRTLYFNTRSEREQATQIYNQLPDKIQLLVSKLVDQVMAMYRTAGQRS